MIAFILMIIVEQGSPGESTYVLCGQYDEKFEECDGAENLTNCKNLSVSCNCEYLMALSGSDFEYVDENTVLFSRQHFEVQLNTSEGLPVICNNFSQNSTTPDRPFIFIIFFGIPMSIIGCSLVLLTICLFKELRTFPAKIIANVAAIVIINDILFILNFTGATGNSGFCDFAAISLHFFVISHFSWMTVMSVEVCHSFYRASRLLPVSVEGLRCKFIIYNIVAWTVPLLIVGTSVIINYTSPVLVQYGKTHDTLVCWIPAVGSEFISFFHSSTSCNFVAAYFNHCWWIFSSHIMQK